MTPNTKINNPDYEMRADIVFGGMNVYSYLDGIGRWECARFFGMKRAAIGSFLIIGDLAGRASAGVGEANSWVELLSLIGVVVGSTGRRDGVFIDTEDGAKDEDEAEDVTKDEADGGRRYTVLTVTQLAAEDGGDGSNLVLGPLAR